MEGPAEMYVIPPLVKKVKGIDLARHGVSVIPIHGTHFGVYAKLFTALRLPKKCVIIADGDLVPSDAQEIECEDHLKPEQLDLEGINNDFIHVFKCKTTFERALTIKGLFNSSFSICRLLRCTNHCKKVTRDICTISYRSIPPNQSYRIGRFCTCYGQANWQS